MWAFGSLTTKGVLLMKNKKLIIVLLCLLTVILSTVACTKKNENINYTVAVTDVNGETVTDENGKNVTVKAEATSVEYVTNEDGQKILDENGKNKTVLHYIVPKVDKNGNTVTGSNKKPVTVKVEPTKKPVTTENSSSVTVVPETTMPEGTTAKEQSNLFEKKYYNIIKSGKFTIDMSWSGKMEGTTMNSNIVFAMSGSDIFMQMKSSSLLNMTMQIISANSKSYIVFPSLKKYCESEEDLGTGDVMGSLGSSSAKYNKTTNVTSGGKSYICEEYSDGTTVYKYYFDVSSSELKRIEMSDSSMSSEPVIITINKFVAGADSSYFTVPGSYKKINMDQLAGVLG